MFTMVAYAIAIDVRFRIAAIGCAVGGVLLRRAGTIAANRASKHNPVPTIRLAINGRDRSVEFPRIAMAIAAHAIQIARELAINVARFRRFASAANAVAACAILRAIKRVFPSRADAVGRSANTRSKAGMKRLWTRWARWILVDLAVAIVVEVVPTRFSR
jgi:hypothetical protein